MSKRVRSGATPVAAAVLTIACAGLARADVVTDWNQAVLDSIAATGTPPPVASRAMAIVHVSVYDAVNGISRRHAPYRVATNPPPASMEAAAAQAAHDALVELFPDRASLYRDLLDTHLDAIADGPAKDAGIAQGALVAAEILDWRADDGSAGPGSYIPSGEPGRWKPTAPGFRPALLPHWGTVTCFAMDSGSQFRPIEPPAMITLDYLDAWREVYELGRIDSTTRTPDQTEIARIWEGGPGTPTPPGQWNEIAQTLAASQGNTLEDNARLFAYLNLATADAAINAWDCKYHYDYWRPITAIWEADADGNPDTTADPLWMPLLTTPPFPTYTSGHSTFSGSSARVLINFFGTDSIPFTFEAIGLSRDFTSLWTAAQEAGVSRIYGGIHYGFDNTAALDAGSRLGEYITSTYLLETCRTDMDGDGTLNVFDFLEFINAYLAGSGRADFDTDGRLDAMDFLQFQNEFAIGCR
jgi:hypothetical protein